MRPIVDFCLHTLVFLAGFSLVIMAVMSAIRTLILPRSSPSFITSFVFRSIRYCFNFYIKKRADTYEERDQIMAFYAPIAVFVLPLAWLIFVMFGYAGMMWAVDPNLNIHDAITLSGSSLMTLGFRFEDNFLLIIMAFSEAALGMMLVALVIGYLPTMYGAFSRREAAVNRLEVRAGSPPSSVEMILRLHRIGFLYQEADMFTMWQEWEMWFYEVEESHTTLAMLNFFRSPKPGNSWLTAAGTVLDCAAILTSTVDIPNKFTFQLTIRAGYIALRSISDFFRLKYDADPSPDAPISIEREEFDEVYDRLMASGIAVLEDRDRCWRDYAGWRVNYDTVLLQLAALLMAPYSPWVSDRGLQVYPRNANQ